ncbi:MAG: hypothetical protein V1895_00320 [Parcubacteria group bacterium]
MERPVLIDYAVSTISEVLGPRTANSYRTFYMSKTEQEIKESFVELLNEYLGSIQAKPYIDRILSIIKPKIK